MTGRRVCFVTCRAWPAISESDGHVARALEARGVAVTGLAWNAAGERFDGFDAVVFRSNWDYHHTVDAFVEWLGRWESGGVHFWNPPELVRWNLSKRYLLDLARWGVDVIPTAILEDSAAKHLPAILAERGWLQAVVKPVVAASAHDTTLVSAPDVGVVASAIDAGRIRRPVLVQPFVEEIQTRGEWSLVFIDGALTHAILKRPAAGDFRVQGHHGGTSARANPPAAVAEAARRALAALPVLPLYARVDGVETDARFLVMELEVHEPGLSFPVAPEAAETFANAIIRRC